MASVAKSRALFQLGFDRFGLIFGRNQDVARAHFLLAGHLLDGFVIDLVHRLVGYGGLADILQHGLHQDLVAFELDAVLDVGAVADLLLLGGLAQHDDVGEIGDEIVALLVRTHLRHVAADLLLGDGKVALADIDAVGAGHNGVGILGAQDSRRQDQ